MSYINAQDSALRAALVSNFLVAELLASRAGDDYLLWLVSPWVTNFALSVPPGGGLSVLVDSAEPQPRLFEVLQQIAVNGGRVLLVVRTERERSRVEQFITPLRTLAAADPNIVIRHRRDLHAKIYAGQYGALHGSLNLTASGVEHNIEFGTYASDVRTIARLRAEARSLFDTAEELPR
ncbi:MAG: hypothetical protein KKA73_01985 [Chloroflexi bacterium]|nr:hypothetical protein [Chloroflexota bacterium]